MTRRHLAFAALFLVVVIASALQHGLASGRWRALPPIDGYTARLAAVPRIVGEWEGVDEKPEDEDMARVGIAGHVFRRYTTPRTEQAVRILLMCGRPGPISVHTPDVCYRGAGYEPIGEQTLETVRLPDGPRSIWKMKFRPPATAASPGKELDVYWLWLSDNGLQAPDNPRIAFADSPAIYKLYVIVSRSGLPQTTAEQSESVSKFLVPFLPAVEAALVEASERD